MPLSNMPNCLMLEVENAWIFLEVGDLDYEMAAIASGQFEVLIALARQPRGCALDAVLFSGNAEGVDRLESRDARKGNRHQEISDLTSDRPECRWPRRHPPRSNDQ